MSWRNILHLIRLTVTSQKNILQRNGQMKFTNPQKNVYKYLNVSHIVIPHDLTLCSPVALAAVTQSKLRPDWHAVVSS